MASLLRPALAAQRFTTGKLLPRDRVLATARSDQVPSESLTCAVNLVYYQSIPQPGMFQAPLGGGGWWFPARRWKLWGLGTNSGNSRVENTPPALEQGFASKRRQPSGVFSLATLN